MGAGKEFHAHGTNRTNRKQRSAASAHNALRPGRPKPSPSPTRPAERLLIVQGPDTDRVCTSSSEAQRDPPCHPPIVLELSTPVPFCASSSGVASISQLALRNVIARSNSTTLSTDAATANSLARSTHCSNSEKHQKMKERT